MAPSPKTRHATNRVQEAAGDCARIGWTRMSRLHAPMTEVSRCRNSDQKRFFP